MQTTRQASNLKKMKIPTKKLHPLLNLGERTNVRVGDVHNA
jgi:hypothetical protein